MWVRLFFYVFSILDLEMKAAFISQSSYLLLSVRCWQVDYWWTDHVSKQWFMFCVGGSQRLAAHQVSH